MIVTTEAIVLRSRKYRETSKLVALYTEEFGKCSVVANGARRAKNKFGSALEPLSCSSVTIYKRANRDLHTLSAAETALPLRALTESFDLLTTGMTMLELVYTSQLEEERNPGLYMLLRESLRLLNGLTTGSPQSLLLSFQLHLAAEMGFAVDPLHCPESGEEVHPDQDTEFVLSLADGAPFSPPLAFNRSGFRIDAATLLVLQQLYTTPLEQASALAADNRTTQQMQDFFGRFFEYHLGHRIGSRTTRFLRETRDDDAESPKFSA